MMEIQGEWICYKYWANEKRRPHHKQDLWPPNHWKFPAPAVSNCHPITKGATKHPAAELLACNLQEHVQNEEREPHTLTRWFFHSVLFSWNFQPSHQHEFSKHSISCLLAAKLTRMVFLTHLWWADFRDKSKWKQRLLQAWKIWTALWKEVHIGTWNKYY